jgi:AcrR family transcriptional regulator
MGRRSIKEERRREIIAGFYSVAKKEGLENTSIAKVASHMEINPSLILHYFKTRDEILLSFNDFILERYMAIFQYSHSRMETVEELVELIDRLFSRRWNRLISDGVFYSCYAKTYQDRELKTRFKTMHDALRRHLHKSLEKAKENGVIDVDNPGELSEKIFLILEGTYYYLGMVEDKSEFRQKLNMMKSQVHEMLGIRISYPEGSLLVK